MARNEILAFLDKLYSGYYKDESVLDRDIEFLKSKVLDPNIIDYIYSSKYDLTPEEIVEKALSYQPIITPPPPPKKEDDES